MGNYSKLIGAIVATVVALLVNKFALPADWASPDGDFIISVTGVITSIVVWAFPANNPSA